MRHSKCRMTAVILMMQLTCAKQNGIVYSSTLKRALWLCASLSSSSSSSWRIHGSVGPWLVNSQVSSHQTTLLRHELGSRSEGTGRGHDLMDTVRFLWWSRRWRSPQGSLVKGPWKPRNGSCSIPSWFITYKDISFKPVRWGIPTLSCISDFIFFGWPWHCKCSWVRVALFKTRKQIASVHQQEIYNDGLEVRMTVRAT